MTPERHNGIFAKIRMLNRKGKQLQEEVLHWQRQIEEFESTIAPGPAVGSERRSQVNGTFTPEQ